MRAATDHGPYATHAFLIGRSVAVVVLPPIRVRTTVLHSDNARHVRSQSVAGVMHTQVLRRWVTAATLVWGSNELTLDGGGVECSRHRHRPHHRRAGNGLNVPRRSVPCSVGVQAVQANGCGATDGDDLITNGVDPA